MLASFRSLLVSSMDGEGSTMALNGPPPSTTTALSLSSAYTPPTMATVGWTGSASQVAFSAVDGTVEKRQKISESFQAMLAYGAISGLIGTLVVFPVDFVKGQLQADPAKLLYKGPVDCVKKIYAADGAVGFYRGLAINLIGVAPEKAMKLALNDFIKRKLVLDDGSLPFHRQMLAGGIAGFMQTVVTTPMEYAKLQFQLNKKFIKGEVKAGRPAPQPLTIKMLFAQVKPRPLILYSGLTATILRDCPFSILYFPLYTHLKETFRFGREETPLKWVFAASCISGAISAWAVTPADVVKTVVQAPGSQHTTLTSAFNHVRAQGPSAFFKGSVPRMIIISQIFGIVLVVYETSKRLLDTYVEPYRKD